MLAKLKYYLVASIVFVVAKVARWVMGDPRE